LIAAGHSVVLAGRRAELLEATARDSGAPAARWLVVPTDIKDPLAVRALFARTRETFGRLDLLFNNAGVNVAAVPFEDLSLEQWREVIDTNLTGAFLCAQEAFRLMKQQQPAGGRIINNGSISAHVPRPNSAPYTSAKHAITGLTKALALDGRAFNIACGQIDIGNADTPLAGRMKKGVLQANGSIAVEPTIDVKHVADAVVYMASLPLEANVSTITVMATQMPYVGRG
jgi:NAD(P)-dependent dehydrogenase (short-subunit alcohol dehydrogenase family)